MARAATAVLVDPARARRMGDQLRESALTMMDPERRDAHERAQDSLLFQRFDGTKWQLAYQSKHP